MKKLTGKAKRAYLMYNAQIDMDTIDGMDVFINALIVEWLDSVGIYISIDQSGDNGLVTHRYEVCVLMGWLTLYESNEGFKSRGSAINEAIKKSVLIFNKMKS